MSKNYLQIFETLVKEKSVEISDGVLLKCGEEINLSIFKDGDNVKVKFGSPSVQVFISKLGPAKLLNVVRPTVEHIVITEKSYNISIDNGPDFEVER